MPRGKEAEGGAPLRRVDGASSRIAASADHRADDGVDRRAGTAVRYKILPHLPLFAAVDSPRSRQRSRSHLENGRPQGTGLLYADGSAF